MADFFNDETHDENVEEKITVGGVDYSQEELDKLISLGKIGAEAEERFNTKIDRVYPEYTKVSQKAKEMERELAELKATRVSQPASESISEDELSRAKAEAKRLGIVTTDEIRSHVEGVFRDLYQRERSTDDLVKRAIGLESTYDGKDGRPKFRADDVLAYMRDTGIADPEIAYKVRYEKELDDWRAKSLNKIRYSGMETQTQSQDRSYKEPKITRDNISDLIRESLYGDGGE